jgi:hypothetical protein
MDEPLGGQELLFRKRLDSIARFAEEPQANAAHVAAQSP